MKKITFTYTLVILFFVCSLNTKALLAMDCSPPKSPPKLAKSRHVHICPTGHERRSLRALAQRENDQPNPEDRIAPLPTSGSKRSSSDLMFDMEGAEPKPPHLSEDHIGQALGSELSHRSFLETPTEFSPTPYSIPISQAVQRAVPQSSSPRIYYSYDKDLTTILLGLIASAQQEVKIACPSLLNKPLIDAIDRSRAKRTVITSQELNFKLRSNELPVNTYRTTCPIDQLYLAIDNDTATHASTLYLKNPDKNDFVSITLLRDAKGIMATFNLFHHLIQNAQKVEG